MWVNNAFETNVNKFQKSSHFIRFSWWVLNRFCSPQMNRSIFVCLKRPHDAKINVNRLLPFNDATAIWWHKVLSSQLTLVSFYQFTSSHLATAARQLHRVGKQQTIRQYSVRHFILHFYRLVSWSSRNTVSQTVTRSAHISVRIPDSSRISHPGNFLTVQRRTCFKSQDQRFCRVFLTMGIFFCRKSQSVATAFKNSPTIVSAMSTNRRSWWFGRKIALMIRIGMLASRY